MKILGWFYCLLVLFLLSGCASGGITAGALQAILSPETTQMTTAISGEIAESSVAKEIAVLKTLQNRDNVQSVMYKESGFKMDWVVIKDDITVNIPNTGPITISRNVYLPKVTYKEAPDFRQPLPTAPSVHPVWDTAKSVVGNLLKYGLIGYGIGELSNVWSDSIAGAQGTTYNGPLINSQNTSDGTITNGSIDYFYGDDKNIINDSYNPINPGI